jgi:NAD-dependent dihydropyrimidine dehydrogenase PreA subunit
VRVTVHLRNLDPALRERITAHIHDNWSKATVTSETNPNPAQGNEAALLILGDGSATVETAAPLKETIIVPSSFSAQQILFLVDAKLGKLTNSDIVNVKRSAPRKAVVSRREFLLGSFAKPPPLQNLPVVASDSCEAKFGCSKCVDACPAPGALRIENSSVIVSSEHCVECGICAGVCPVAAIQTPSFSEDAYVGLLKALHDSSAPKKTLVITCNKSSVPRQAWMDVEEVRGIGSVGVRQLAMAADSSISALLVYCPDGLCVGKENAKRAANLISSIKGEHGPTVAYLEGSAGILQMDQNHKSAQVHDGTLTPAGTPWREYVKSLKSISTTEAQVKGLGLTEMKVADSCTLCYACVETCPHKGALAIQEDTLIFTPEECTGCGYCEQTCPERSITLTEMAGSIKLSARTVYKDEMIRCAKCNTPYVSAKMFKKVSATLQSDETTLKLCQSCKQKEAYEKILGSTRGPP